MAGDWIKVECTLPDKPEVFWLADLLTLDRDAVVGKCLRFWVWINQNMSRDGHAKGVTAVTVGHIVSHAGFGEALETVGWVRFDSAGMTIPNFDRHNSESAKHRALAAERKRKSRLNGHDERVTDVTQERDTSVTREEKRVPLPKGSGSTARARGTTTTTKTASAVSGADARSATPPQPEAPFREIVSAWNELCPKLRPVQGAAPGRSQAIVIFWEWIGRDLEAVRDFFARVGRSRLLNGERHSRKSDRKPFPTSFDWVLKPDNAVRIVEGEFDDAEGAA